MTINAIFATDSRGGLGFRGSLPWPHNTEDLQWFKEHTANQIVVMGRNTWDDPKFPKPLPGRVCCVFTNRFIKMDRVFCLAGDYRKQILKLEKEFPNKDIYIIGGKSLLEATQPLVENLYLTMMKNTYKIDVSIDLRTYLKGFRIMSAKPTELCTFTVYKNENPFII